MKYAIIIPDGCADEPQESLRGKTPLEAADVPAMDSVARAGVVGRACHVPEALPPGSDVANLSLFGYNPIEHYTGRAPLEAVAQGIELGPDDWAVRCNLVTIEDQVMRDFTAGHISSEEGAELIRALQEKLGSDRLQFYPGVSYRNLLVYRGGPGKGDRSNLPERPEGGHHAEHGRAQIGPVPFSFSPGPFSIDTRSTPPHDLTDKSVLDSYPRGPGSDLLVQLMEESVEVFADHPVNVRRREEGKLPCTNIWLWGLGGAPRLEPFARRFGIQGAMITAVDLLRGLAVLLGWKRIEVPGATGYTDTDYAAKGRYAVEALEEVDLVCVHVEATDEASHEGDTAAKVKALEEIDRHIVGPLHAALKRYGEYRILVTPDHPTPLRIKTHSHGYVPWTIAGAGIQPGGFSCYDDPTGMKSDLVFHDGWKLMEYFITGIRG